MHHYNYRSVLSKCPLPGKRPCTPFQGVNVAASIQTYGILILEECPCRPKLRVMFKCPWALTRDTTVCSYWGYGRVFHFYLNCWSTLVVQALGKVLVYPVFSPSKIEGMIGGHGVSGVCSHFKTFGLSHQREFCTEGLLNRHALDMLGRTLYTKKYMEKISSILKNTYFNDKGHQSLHLHVHIMRIQCQFLTSMTYTFSYVRCACTPTCNNIHV